MKADLVPTHSTPAVLGLGYCAYDVLAIVPHMPVFDDVHGIHSPEMVRDGGGPVANALAALARLGMPTGYMGVLSTGPEGRWLRELFVQAGIDVSRLRMSDHVGLNFCLLLVEENTGRRAIVCHPGVEATALALDAGDRSAIQSARVLHLDGQFLPAAVQAARWARQAGVRVCLDGNHPRPGLDELLPLVDWLVVAAPFPGEYTGLADPAGAARELLALGPELLVVTRGEQGCLAWTRGGAQEPLRVPAFAVEPVDTTGAGDAFHGGLIYALLQGWPLPRALRFANAVAGLNCQTLGGRRGLPDLPAVEALLARTPRPGPDQPEPGRLPGN